MSIPFADKSGNVYVKNGMAVTDYGKCCGVGCADFGYIDPVNGSCPIGTVSYTVPAGTSYTDKNGNTAYLVTALSCCEYMASCGNFPPPGKTCNDPERLQSTQTFGSGTAPQCCAHTVPKGTQGCNATGGMVTAETDLACWDCDPNCVSDHECYWFGTDYYNVGDPQMSLDTNAVSVTMPKGSAFVSPYTNINKTGTSEIVMYCLKYTFTCGSFSNDCGGTSYVTTNCCPGCVSKTIQGGKTEYCGPGGTVNGAHQQGYLTCYDCAAGTCADWGYVDSNTGGCIKVQVNKDDSTISVITGQTVTMPQTTDCWKDCGLDATCADFNEEETNTNCKLGYTPASTSHAAGQTSPTGSVVGAAGLSCYVCDPDCQASCDMIKDACGNGCQNTNFSNTNCGSGCTGNVTGTTYQKGQTIPSGCLGGIATWWQTTTCYCCDTGQTCSDFGDYDNVTSAPCTNAVQSQHTTPSGTTLFCWTCGGTATCKDFGLEDTNPGGCTSSSQAPGTKASNGNVVDSNGLWCYDCGPDCSALGGCETKGGGSYWPVGTGDYCEYQHATCSDFGYEDATSQQIKTGQGYNCTPQAVTPGQCSGNITWAPYGMSCYTCTYPITPFQPLGPDGMLVFVGLT